MLRYVRNFAVVAHYCGIVVLNPARLNKCVNDVKIVITDGGLGGIPVESKVLVRSSHCGCQNIAYIRFQIHRTTDLVLFAY